MHRFNNYENIKHFKELLQRTTDKAERDRILNLLAEEEAKAHNVQPGNKIEAVVHSVQLVRLEGCHGRLARLVAW